MKTKHVSEKKKIVEELAEKMKKRTVMVVSIKGLPSAQFQEIKKKIRGKAEICVAKKNLINFAMARTGIKELIELIKFVEDNSAILFSDEDAFEISEILSIEKSPAKAKAGQIAPKDIVVKAGPTSLTAGPDISALSAVGLSPKVEGGKISIMQDKVILRKGEVINEEIASIMAKLDIIPFEVGVEPIAAFMNGKVYTNIRINKDETIEEILKSYSQSLAFAIEIDYISPDTLEFMLVRAALHENSLRELVNEKNENTREKKDEEENEKSSA